MKVVMPSTSSQWFHMLREQALSEEPKPLVVMSPKGQLYGNAQSHSALAELMAARLLRCSRTAAWARLKTSHVSYCAAASFSTTCRRRARLPAIRAPLSFASSSCIRSRESSLPSRSPLVGILSQWCGRRERKRNTARGISCVTKPAKRFRRTGRVLDVCRRESPSGAHSSMRAHRDEQQRLVTQALARV
jgi:2-oxoglutarate dehydrogenase E1 component